MSRGLLIMHHNCTHKSTGTTAAIGRLAQPVHQPMADELLEKSFQKAPFWWKQAHWKMLSIKKMNKIVLKGKEIAKVIKGQVCKQIIYANKIKIKWVCHNVNCFWNNKEMNWTVMVQQEIKNPSERNQESKSLSQPHPNFKPHPIMSNLVLHRCWAFLSQSATDFCHNNFDHH